MNVNIERFDELTGLIFAKLYACFPIPTKLNIMEFHEVFRSTKGGAEPNYYPVEPPFFSASVRWLIESGYISSRAQWAETNTFTECTLTAKALEILKATPSILKGKSIGDELQSAVKGGAFESIKALTNDALSRGFSIAVKAASELSIS